MGLAVIIIYLPLLLLVSIASLVLAALELRSSPVSNGSVFVKLIFYVIGLSLSVTVTSLSAWWYSDLTSSEWGRLFRWMGVSLIGPLIIGILLFAIGVLTGDSRQKSILVAGAFHATMLMPFAGLTIASCYDDVVYKPAFDKLCADTQPVFLEKVAPAKNFILLSWWLQGQSRLSANLLLAEGTSLSYIDVKKMGEDKAWHVTALSPDQVQTAEGPAGGVDRIQSREITIEPAEYEVEAISHEPPADIRGRGAISGYRIEIRRTVDKKLIAYSDTYQRIGQNWECPAGLSKGSFTEQFIAAALDLPTR